MRFPFKRNRDVVLEKADTTRAEAVSDLHARCFDRQWGTAEMVRLLEQDNVTCITAHEVGKPQAAPLAFVLFRNIVDEAEILSIGVDPAARGLGQARKLMDEAIRHLHGERVKSLFLEVDAENKPAVSLYRNLQFETISKRPAYYQAADGKKSAALVMRLDLV